MNNFLRDEQDINSAVIFFAGSNCEKRKLRIQLASPISILFQLFQNNEQIFFYNEKLVSPSQTFAELGISNGDRITSTPKNKCSTEKDFWRKISSSKPIEKHYFSSYSNGQTKNIWRRILDLSYFQTENSPKIFRKLIHNFQFLQNSEQLEDFQTNVNFRGNESPNSSKLPILWEN
jgi:hypothetical protein